MNIAEIRKQYPQYNDLSDQQLADSLHGSFYSDIPKEEFYNKVGLTASKPGLIDAFKGAGASMAAGVNAANASLLDKMAKGARKISEATGLPTGGAFESGAKIAREGADYWRQKAGGFGVTPESLPAKVYEGVGSAPMAVAEFTAGVPAAVASGAAEGKGITEGLKRFAVGKVFKGLEAANLSPIQRSGAMAGTMAAQTAAEGGSVQDVVAAGLTGLALSAPSEGGRASVNRQNMQRAGVQPEVAADLAGRLSPDAQPQGTGYIDVNRFDQAAPGMDTSKPVVLDAEAARPAETVRPAERGPVLDAENPSLITNVPIIRGGPGDAMSIEVARTRAEHPDWKDADVWTQAEKSLRLEGVPAATERDAVQPAVAGEVRQSEDAPGLRRGLPIGDQEMGQRFGTSDRLTDPVTGEVINPEVLPARTERDVTGQPSGEPVRPAENAPSRTVEPVSMENFNHDNLPDAAITAADSLAVPPSVKAAVVGTPAEISALVQPGKAVLRAGDRAYLIDRAEAAKQFGSLAEAKKMLLAGSESEAKVLGYPERPAGVPLETAAVSKTGEVLTDPAEIQRAATVSELAYAAEGAGGEAVKAAERVGEAIKGGDPNGQKEGGRQEVLTNPDAGDIVNMHAGVHIPTLIKQVYDKYFRKLDADAPAGSVKAFLDSNREANAKHATEPITNALRRALIDASANVQDALMRLGPTGEFVRRQFDAISGASAKAQLVVDAQREMLKDMSLREQQAMGDLIAIDRDLAINKPGYTKIGGKTDAELAAARQNFQTDYKLTDAEMARVDAATKSYFDAWRGNTQRLLDAGLIDATEKAKLDAQDYSPKQFLEKIDPDTNQFGSLGGRVTVPDSGIKRLKQGSDGYFRNNPMRLLSEATARIETRIARNEANQALATLPAGNGIAEVVKPGTAAPDGYESFSYMENGKPRTIHMKSEYAKEWRQNDPLVNSSLATWLQWLTGAKAVRALATGYNPAFLLTNTPRDMVTIWLQSEKKGYSPLAPKALVEMAGDMRAVAKDAWNRTGRYVDYVKEGGGRELLTHEGALTNRRENLAPAVAQVQKTLSYVNEFSELITRLAYRERLIKNGMDPASASKTAGEYVDFSRGGVVTKAIDRMGVPYLNAAIQGTRSLARASGRDPGQFAFKTAQLMVGATGLYALNQMSNPEGWANVSDREKAGNWIIMLPKTFEYTDKDGTLVSPYIKISKEQSMRPFATVAELAASWANGGKPSAQQISMALTDALPVSIDKMPPTAAAFWTYILNADTYKKEPVWKGKQEIEPFAEYTNQTNPIYRDIGKATASNGKGGLSPERLKAGVEKVLPSTNFYSQAAGGLLTDVYEKMNPSDKTEFAKSNLEKLRSVPGVSRLLSGAKDTEQFREGIREARVSTNTKLFEENKGLDALALRYAKGGMTDPMLQKRIIDYVGDNERLQRRVDDVIETANLPDRGWWLATKALSPEDRADQFKERYNKVDPAEQARMLEIANGLKGYVSDRFTERYDAGSP